MKFSLCSSRQRERCERCRELQSGSPVASSTKPRSPTPEYSRKPAGVCHVQPEQSPGTLGHSTRERSPGSTSDPESARKGITLTQSAPRFAVGIDVAKDKLDVDFYPEARPFSVGNDEKGMATLLKQIPRGNLKRIVLEGSGGYERELLAELAAAGLPVVRVNPKQARDFAKAMGYTAKTDAIDARVLAHLGAIADFENTLVPDEKRQQLIDHVTRRRQLRDMLTAERNREKQARDNRVKRSVRSVIKVLQKQLQQLDDDIRTLVRDTPEWAERDAILQSVPGVGDHTARMLIAELPELGMYSRKQIAALSGVAPFNHDSGKHRGKRRIRGGRSNVRSALYMATLVATRHNSVIRAHYKQLLERGKQKMVALVACMRKLLTILNALVRNNQTWNPTPNNT